MDKFNSHDQTHTTCIRITCNIINGVLCNVYDPTNCKQSKLISSSHTQWRITPDAKREMFMDAGVYYLRLNASCCLNVLFSCALSI